MSTQRYSPKALSYRSLSAHTARTSSPVKTVGTDMRRHAKKNPDAQRQEKRKPVRRGTRVNKYSLSAQPPVPPNGLKTYLQLTEADAPNLPRLDLESPRIFRGELYCRYPGCSVTTRYGQPCALLDHYKIKHDLELKAFKTSIGPVGRKQHGDCKVWLAQYAQLGQENVGPAPPPAFG
ncbi:hypothetical protein PENPOL_c004G07362 [Penicillium polonicum]|uniref:Uncharacterized protein n=1 Tax=Penicillium polonicum TaxID=60169 RepID=A0A1V6NPJ4_PENPO|nr:hypothetical protein PENPOL_c004G07362 [Penicillium polonicum]